MYWGGWWNRAERHRHRGGSRCKKGFLTGAGSNAAPKHCNGMCIYIHTIALMYNSKSLRLSALARLLCHPAHCEAMQGACS
jgi:hypothetical protein